MCVTQCITARTSDQSQILRRGHEWRFDPIPDPAFSVWCPKLGLYGATKQPCVNQFFKPCFYCLDDR